jgi:hypothetical protein
MMLRRYHGAPKHPQVDIPRPTSSDNKATWEAYAEHLGLGGGGTKAEIVERVEAHEAEHPVEPGGPDDGVTTSKDLTAPAGE